MVVQLQAGGSLLAPSRQGRCAVSRRAARIDSLLGALTVVAAAAAIPCGLASAAAGHSGSTVIIHTIQKSIALTTVDADHNGKASVGDYKVDEVVHVDPATGKKVGTGIAICTQVTANGRLYDCQASDVLPGGELRESGRFTLGKTWRFAIVGGSGKFDGASGSVSGTWLEKFSRSRDVFEIKVPG
jgi:hypothetical protein